MQYKVILTYKDVNGNLAEESVWTESILNNLYRVDNIPFFAPNLAYNDIIHAEEDDGELHFEGLITASGHSTIQIVFFKEDEDPKVLKQLDEKGCDWEGMKGGIYYAIDIPPKVNYSAIKEILNLKRNKGILDYKESCLANS